MSKPGEDEITESESTEAQVTAPKSAASKGGAKGSATKGGATKGGAGKAAASKAKAKKPPAEELGPLRNQLFPIGVDYYPLDEERQSFSDWYTRDFDADFAAIAEARISLVRVFVSWKLFEPQVGQYDADADDRLG